MRSAIAENQATFMCYPPVNTVYDEKIYFWVIVAVPKKLSLLFTLSYNYLKPWSANTRIYYMARIMVLQEYYWETHRILVETSTERAETQVYMLFELLEYIETTTATIWYK